MRANSRPRARATDRPSEVLPGSGRPDQRQDHAAAPVVHAALAPQAAHGQVLQDPLLDLVEPGVVGVQHLAGVGHVEVLLGALPHGSETIHSR